MLAAATLNGSLAVSDGVTVTLLLLLLLLVLLPCVCRYNRTGYPTVTCQAGECVRFKVTLPRSHLHGLAT
jgi:hypothetical protein